MPFRWSYRRPGTTGWPGRIILRWLAAAGLAVDAYIHAHLADHYDAVTRSISQGDLFRIEAGLAALAALLLLMWPRRSAIAFAFVVAAGGLAALLLYRYVDVGTLGPLPNMYEPIWSTDKQIAAIAEAVAALATGFLLRTRTRLIGV